MYLCISSLSIEAESIVRGLKFAGWHRYGQSGANPVRCKGKQQLPIKVNG